MKQLGIALFMSAFVSQVSAVDLQQAANDVCACLKAPYALVDKSLASLKSAQASGDYSKMAQAQGEMMSVMSASGECFEKLPLKYPEIDQRVELQTQVMAVAEKQCPNPAKGLTP